MHAYVRCKPGRIARDDTGKLIPTDQYVLVRWSRRIERLVAVHQDIELRPQRDKNEPADAGAEPSPEAAAVEPVGKPARRKKSSEVEPGQPE